MNIIFLLVPAFAGAAIFIVEAWPWLGVAAIVVAPFGASVACVASAAF